MPIYVQGLEVVSDNQDLTLTNTATTFGTTLKIPTGTNAQRPGSPEPGSIRYNTESNQVEGWTGLNWVPLRSPTYALANSASTVDEGNSVTFTLTTTGVSDGTLVPWYLITSNVLGVSGFANVTDLVGGTTTGNFNVSSCTATQTFTFVQEPDVLYVVGNSAVGVSFNTAAAVSAATGYSTTSSMENISKLWLFVPASGSTIYYSSAKTIYRELMTTPHLLSSMNSTLNQSRAITTAGTLSTATLNQPRSKFFWWDRTIGRMYQHNFAATGDLTNLSQTSEASWTIGNSNVSASSVSGIAWSSNGHRIYITSNSNNAVLSYAAGTVNVISPAPTFLNSFALSNTNPRGISFNARGTKMYIAHTATIEQYNLGTAWNVATATFNSRFTPTSVYSDPKVIGGITVRTNVVGTDFLPDTFVEPDELFTLALNTVPISNTILVKDV